MIVNIFLIAIFIIGPLSFLNVFENIYLLLTLSLYFLFFIKHPKIILTKSKLFFLMTLLSVLVALIHKEFTPIFTIGFYYLTLNFFSQYSLKRNYVYMHNLFKFTSISNLIYILLSLYFFGLYYPSYQSFFNNPNPLGLYSSLSLLILLPLVFYEKKIFFKLIFIFCLIFSAIFLISSTSRTAIFSTLIALSSFFLIKSYLNIFVRKLNLKKILLFLFLFFCICIFIFLFEDIIVSITIKDQFYLSENNWTNNRLEVWIKQLNGLNLFGYGVDYNTKLNLYKDYDHNTYLTQLSRYGVFWFILYILLILIILFKSILVLFKYNNLLADIFYLLSLSTALIFFFETASKSFNIFIMIALFAFFNSKKIINNE